MENKKRKPIVAAILSSVAPGLGQLYNGQLVKGIVFLLAVFLLPFILFLTGLQYSFYGLITIILFSLFLLLFVIGEAFFSAKKIKEYTLKPYNKWYIYLIIILLLNSTALIPPNVLAVAAHKVLGFGAYKMPTGSMEPTLTRGDHIIVNFRYFKKNELQRGDLVILRYPYDPSKDFVKRVIALEGEKIEIKNRLVYINDVFLPEGYKIHIRKLAPPEADNFGPVEVPANHCFVMGDNRDNSQDCRIWGPLSLSNIKGKPLFIYWAKDITRIGMKIE